MLEAIRGGAQCDVIKRGGGGGGGGRGYCDGGGGSKTVSICVM